MTTANKLINITSLLNKFEDRYNRAVKLSQFSQLRFNCFSFSNKSLSSGISYEELLDILEWDREDISDNSR